jgi:hypothetical protein
MFIQIRQVVGIDGVGQHRPLAGPDDDKRVYEVVHVYPRSLGVWVD